jgi:hypothetical protein
MLRRRRTSVVTTAAVLAAAAGVSPPATGALGASTGAAQTASAAAHARAAATPYDGLMFRTFTPSARTGGSSFVRGCSGGLPMLNLRAVATTLQPSASGANVTKGIVSLTLNGDRLVSIRGFGPTSRRGDGIGFNTPTAALGSCTPLASIATSAAGDLYRMEWSGQVCENDACTITRNDHRGEGCVALRRVGDALAATFRVGDCTASAFPALPAGWSQPLRPAVLRRGMLDGLVIRFSGQKLLSMRGQGGLCGNRPKMKLTAGGDTLVVLDSPRRAKVAPPLTIDNVGIFGMDVNTRDQAYTWGGVVSLLVNGGTAAIMFNQSNPETASNCRTRPRPRSFTTSLPTSVWGGRNYRTYLGEATMRATIDEPGKPWSVTVRFGSR